MVDLTGTVDIDLLINQNASFNFMLELEDEAGGTINWPTGSYSLSIFNSNKVAVQTITSPDITVNNNQLTILRNALQNNLQNGKYFYEIKIQQPDNIVLYPIVGKILVNERLL